MTGLILLNTASIVITLWGAAHIMPVRDVVAGFEPLSSDNRRVLIMEWVAEGLALGFIGVLTLLITAAGLSDTEAAILVYRVCAVMLVVMAIWTGVTGARTSVVFFKLCPVIKSVCAVLLVVGSGI
jgi:hypothetical protein